MLIAPINAFSLIASSLARVSEPCCFLFSSFLQMHEQQVQGCVNDVEMTQQADQRGWGSSFVSDDSVSQSSLFSIQPWMLMHKLKQADETELLLNGTERQWNKYLSMFLIDIFGVTNQPRKVCMESWRNI